MASAEDLGKRLLSEDDEMGLDEIFNSLRPQDQDSPKDAFHLHALDRLLQNLAQAKTQSSNTKCTPPIVELMSLHPGAGKTHLLYYLCAKAVLPRYASGQQACVVVLDTDGKFSVPRLAVQVESLLRKASPPAIDPIMVEGTVQIALKHVHVFRPQTLASTVATVDSLPAYLFDQEQHFSFDRQVGLIALDTESTFYWQDRAETENAAFYASTAGAGGKTDASPQSDYNRLAASLREACKTFKCPAIITSWHLGSNNNTSQQQQERHTRSYRSSFPAPFAQLPTLRLVVQRVPVRRFPLDITIDGALRESEDRQKAVDEGKYACFVNEWSMDERIAQRLSEMEGGNGFRFKIIGQGVVFDDKS